RLAARPEDFGDDPFAAVLRRREAEHLEDDLVVRPGAFGARVADVNAVTEYRAVHANVALAFALEIGADKLAGRALEDADDLTHRVKVGPVRLTQDADQDLVAGGRVERIVLADVNFRAHVA